MKWSYETYLSASVNLAAVHALLELSRLLSNRQLGINNLKSLCSFNYFFSWKWFLDEPPIALCEHWQQLIFTYLHWENLNYLREFFNFSLILKHLITSMNKKRCTYFERIRCMSTICSNDWRQAFNDHLSIELRFEK